MFKSKIGERVQEVILPDFPDDENTVPTVTKSRRVSFGTNFVKEFIVGSAVSGQCLPEYEQAFPSSDSSNADSSHSAVEMGVLEHSVFVPPADVQKIHKPPSQPLESDFAESRPKMAKFSSTVCFSADSPTADMEFTEGCITLAKSILEKKNKEMTVIIQAKPKEAKGEEKPAKEEETKYFDGSQFEMSMTRCLKSKGNKREEKRFECEKTKIFSKYENEMSITRCNKIFTEDDDTESSWEDCKENRMPLDMIMRHLDKENSDLENDLFNPEKNLDNFFKGDMLDLTNESEKLNLNESMDISTDFQVRPPRSLTEFPVREPTNFDIEKLLTTGDDGIDKSVDDLILNEAEGKVESSPKSDDKMNKLVLRESNVLTADVEQSIQVPPANGRIDRSTQQLSLDGSVEQFPEKQLVVESTVTDHKIISSAESQEGVPRETESMVLELSGTDRRSESEELSRVEQSTNHNNLNTPAERISLVDGSYGGFIPGNEAKEEPVVEERNKSSEHVTLERSDGALTSEKGAAKEPIVEETNKSPKRMSLDGSVGPVTPEKGVTEQPIVEETDRLSKRVTSNGALTPEKGIAEEPFVDETNNSPERMSLDGSNEVLPSKIVESPVGSPGDHEMNKSTQRSSSVEKDDIEDIPREESLMELTSTDTGAEKISKSTEPVPFSNEIIVSVESKTVDLPSSDQISISAEPQTVDVTSADELSLPVEPKMVDMSSADQVSMSVEPNVVDMPSADQGLVESEMTDMTPGDKITESMVVDQPQTETELSPSQPTLSKSRESLNETEREPSLVDLRIIESLKEQSKETGCLWCLTDIRHPQRKAEGWLLFNCKLLDSTTGICFKSKMTNEDSPVACSIVTSSEINLTEESQLQLPEYRLVVDFGFGELKKYFNKHQTQVETIRHVSYFLDQVNSFVVKMNGCLRQILTILTMYPGSRLEGSRLSFRLFSFPVFFSSTVSIDLSNYFRLSKSSVSFETDLGSLDENKITEIFVECLKRENSLCEFIVESTKYLIDLEKESGRVSKRGHIRFLPDELNFA